MINIAIATQQPIFRAGLAKLIAVEDDFRIVAQPLSVAHLRDAIQKLRPHVVLLSSDFFVSREELAAVVRLAPTSGFAALALTERADQAFEFVTLGAQGVLPRKVHVDALVDGIRRVARGEMCLQTEAGPMAAADTNSVGQTVASRLSRRDLRIVAAMLRGYKNAEIAQQLGMTVPLLKKQISTIYDKTGVWGRMELALFVLHHQVLALAQAHQRPAALRTGTSAADAERRAMERMFGTAAKLGRRAASGPGSRGTSFGTTGAPPECGK